MNFINLENLNIINFELTDYCNAACPMCVRHDWDGNLRKNLVNTGIFKPAFNHFF